MKRSRHALLKSILSLMLCLSMLIGTTFAWFTDEVTSGTNMIAAGNLDIELEYLDSDVWKKVDESTEVLDKDALWEPGYTEVAYLRISNAGNLALKYALGIGILEESGSFNEAGEYFLLSDHIKFGVVETTEQVTYAKRSDAINALTESKLISAGYTSEYELESTDGEDVRYATLVLYMPEETTNVANYATGQNPPEIKLGIKVVATQATSESDSFGDDYDTGAVMPGFDFPENTFGENISESVTTDSENKVVDGVTIQGTTTNAVIPAGVQLEAGTTALTLEVNSMSQSGANVVPGENEAIRSLNVHVKGVAADNAIPMEIYIKEAAAKGLNAGNLKLYHVENGTTVQMTAVDTFTAHNQFKYDPVTGDITLYMATFSEVTVVANTVNAWKGEFDYSWYINAVAPVDGDAVTEYTIANADQLAAFGAIVGGMNGQTQDSFAGKIVKLLADVNLGDVETENNPDLIFYPIGYYNSTGSYGKTSGGSVTSSVSSFEGTFDGQGHTIANFYQNTWEMFGDYNDGYSGTPNHYKDAMGLFGYVLNGTIKNLTVNNFSSDGEFTPTGVIAAYADGNSTFENIAITNCNPRVYNTGNGGIIGIAGDTSTANDDHITLKNITVDNSNTISALWGSYDVACGGLVGMYRGNVDGSGNATGDTISFENCHVSAQIDVYNDVCGNYQYYAYRYAGMIIGSVRHNTKNAEGKTIPNMEGISASGCTVNYGDWNDYYYCEFEKNTMASYSEDYQFSRVPHSELNFTDSNSNGVVDANERASVTGCKHDHTAEENHQAIYLPFHQLFTGYSWGVSSIGLEKYSGIVTDLDITEGDQEESVVKFEKITPLTEYPSGYTVKISDLFGEIDGNKVAIVDNAVQVFVSPAEENSTVTGEYKASSDDWKKSTITFGGTGKAKITITDYYFCNETTFEITVVEGLKLDEFAVLFPNTDKYIYRVGDDNAITLGDLFRKCNGVSVMDADVDVTSSSIPMTYTKNQTDWTKSTIKFDGTGLTTIIITDNCGYSEPLVLSVEVVDAYNVVGYSDLKDGRNSVFLKDIVMAGGGTYRLTGGNTLYGNGFTFDVRNGAYTGVEYDYASYVIYLENSRLDNVNIVGAVYPEVGAYKTDNYNRAIVMTNGECSIVNSYISNGASPVRNGGNLDLVNTTLKGGVYANLDIRNGHVILDNVTTINQIGINDKYNDTTEVVGMGVVVYQEGGTDELKITIRNDLTQYNYLSKEQADTYFTDTYSKTIKDIVFGIDFEQYQNSGLINFGIISMNNYFTEDDLIDERTEKEGYFGTAKTITLLGNSRNCYVYSITPDGEETPNPDESVIAGQGIIAPNVDFDFTNKNYQQKVEGSNDYCYADGGKVFISMDEGDTFNWDTSILTVTKNGQTLPYTVSMNDTDYTGKSIAFNESGNYEVEYIYIDPNNYNADGTKRDITYTKLLVINVSVIKQSAKNAVFSFGANGTAYTGKTVTVGDKTYVMPDVTATVSGKIGSKTVNGTTIYYPIAEMYTSDGVTAHKGSWYACFPIFKDVVQITDYKDNGTGEAVTYNQTNVKTVEQIPVALKAVDPKTAFLYSMNATNYPPPTDPTAVSGAVCYTCNRNGLTASNTRKEENTVAEYTYTDNAGKVYYYYVGYHCEEQTNGCVTPDTLITLADGSQVRVDSLTGNEQLLVWNLETGKYDTAPIVFVDNEQESEYEIIHLYFSDGSDVKVISEHGFFDLDLGKYVYIDAQNYADYVGHRFVTEGDIATNDWNVVTLDQVAIETEVTTAWSPVTFSHLCYYTNGVLSMPGGIEGLFNIYEVDIDTMSYDAAQKQKDIETYGLFTIEDFGGLIPEEAFEAFNGKDLKVAMGKGLLTWEDIAYMAERYVPLMK